MHLCHCFFERADKLKPGTFIAAQDREDQNFAVPFLIGITVDHGNGSCIVQRDFDKRTKIDGTTFDPGDCAIVVRWLSRVSADSEQRAFTLDVSTPQVTLNSTELRCVIDKLDVVKQAQHVRRSARATVRARDWHEKEPVQYQLPADSEQAILNSCW